MVNDRVLGPILLSYLPDIRLDFSGGVSLVPADVDSDSTMDWWVTGTLEIADDTRRGGDTLSWSEVPHVSLDDVQVEGDGSVRLVVFSMSGFTVDADDVADLGDTLDARDADAAHFMPLADPETGGLIADLERFAFGSNVVIVDRVRLAPAWRGLGGIGRLLTATALKWLSDGAAVIALHPHPYALAERPRSHPDFAGELERVRRTWADLGFAPLPGRDDLWVVDPASNSLVNAEGTLRSALLESS